jgi:simple sugar transport system ATP-binding protein
MTNPSSMSSAVRMDGIVKRFGGVVANRDATLDVATGEIHALVGENGAGKSTLMRVLAGLYAPDGGTMQVNGRDVTGWSTPQAIAAGVGMVHQHFMLVPTLTVAENVVLGMEPTTGVRLDMTKAVADVKALCARSGLHVDPTATVADLSVGEAQRVEILKALYRGARILILDEPTAVLSPPEVRDLWDVLRTLKAGGGTVVLITHKLDEVIAVSDTITVLRAGQTVSRFATAGTTPREIARAMVGREVALAGDAPATTARSSAGASGRTAGQAAGLSAGGVGQAGLQISGLTVRSDRGMVAVNNLSFEVAPGEILGIAGVEGNGQTELLEAIAGLRTPVSGSMRLGARDLAGLPVRERADAGLSHIPEDRHRRGLILEYSIADNLILGRQHHFSSARGLDTARIAAHAARQVQQFDIRPAITSLPARALSGGNQQKIVIAREMGRDFTLLLAAQPTRGVDVGAIEFIHEQIRMARNAGKGILLVSADLSEVLALSDRIAVMYGGRFVTVTPAAEATAESLGRYMTGAAS